MTDSVLPHVDLHIADIAVIAAYFIFIFILGWWVWRQTRTGNDLFLAGRSLTWSVIGFSLFASNISSTTLVGLTGTAYTTGISVANYEWMAAFILVFMVFFSIPRYLRLGIRTVPEFLEHHYSPACRRYFSLLNIFLIVVVDTAAGLYAGALVLKIFFPAMDIWQLCAIVAVVAGLYTMGGGLKAVAFTDVAQAVILIAGSCCLTWIVLQKIDLSWSEAIASLPKERMSLIRPLDDPFLPWLGTLIGVPILGFYFWSSNQFITQRILGAKNLQHARWGALFAGALKIIPLFIMIIPGALAVLIMPGIENGDQVFPRLMIELLPPGLMGLMLAALIAAVMSSVDSSLNSGSTLITLDFIEKPGKPLTPQKSAQLGRIITLILMILSAIWAPMIQNFPGLWHYLQSVLAYAISPVAVLYFFAVTGFSGRGYAGVRTLGITHIASVLLFILNIVGWLDIHFTYIAAILFAIGTTVFLLHPRRPEQPLSQPPAEPDAPEPWWADYRILSAALILLTSAVVIAFW